MPFNPLKNHRILVIDDNRSIHEDFRRILKTTSLLPHDLASYEDALFGRPTAVTIKAPVFEIDSAYQAQEGYDLVEKSMSEDRPYSLAFVDIRMPPGSDGMETISKIWQKYPDLQVVICTAFSDYTWKEMLRALGYTDRLLILKKPFDSIEVLQMAIAMTEKWRLLQQVKLRLEDLERIVQESKLTLKDFR
jgi:CheY-like chemotaxis protein